MFADVSGQSSGCQERLGRFDHTPEDQTGLTSQPRLGQGGWVGVELESPVDRYGEASPAAHLPREADLPIQPQDGRAGYRPGAASQRLGLDPSFVGLPRRARSSPSRSSTTTTRWGTPTVAKAILPSPGSDLISG